MSLRNVVSVVALAVGVSCARPTVSEFDSTYHRLCSADAPCPPSWKCQTEREDLIEISYCVLPCKSASDCPTFSGRSSECMVGEVDQETGRPNSYVCVVASKPKEGDAGAKR